MKTALVALELKAGAFKPEYTGKMNFYLTVLNEKIKTEDEAASIGIIICKDKNRTIVEYALGDHGEHIGYTGCANEIAVCLDDWQYVCICGFISRIMGLFPVPIQKILLFLVTKPSVRQVVSKFFFDFSVFMLKLQWN